MAQRAVSFWFAWSLAGLGGCALISVKSPERPLSARDMNTRVLTREYSAHFIAAIDATADRITGDDDPGLQANALRWKIASTTQSLSAATQIAPLMSLLDTWALALQMKAFMQEGQGGSLFGTHQASVRVVVDGQADDAEAMARRLLPPKEFPRYQKFVESYVSEHPLRDLDLLRPSIVELWNRDANADIKLVDSLGTIPEAMTNVADRLQMYGDTLPSQTLWRAELALGNSGYSTKDLRAALVQLDNRLDRLAAAADNAPELVHGAIGDVRSSVITVVDRLNATSASMMVELRAERIALTADVRSEREAALAAVDEQRKALALDAASLSDRVVTTAGQELRHLAREAALLVIVMAVVLLGLPFGAGYMVGRLRRVPRDA
jgi:hypothetical protein